MLSAETRAEICRLVRAEHLSMTKVGKILGIHHSTVKNVLNRDGQAPIVIRVKKSHLDNFMPLIHQKLDEYPDIKATVIWRMLNDRGYLGSESTVRHRMRNIRGARPKKAFFPITTFAGDEAQVDWAHFGSMKVGRGERKLSCFIMVLAHSRAVFARFYFDQTLDNFLDGHVEGFRQFGGVPRIIRYDNLKAAVAERHGQNIRFNPSLLDLAAHYAFKPSACNPYSGHEKGRVERTVRYIRESFFCGKEFSTMKAINTALTHWIETVADQRGWPDDRQRKVYEVFEEEKKLLITLPQSHFNSCQERPAKSSKFPFIRFDSNSYSIPYQLAGQVLSLSTSPVEVTIKDRGEVVAVHQRSYSRGEKIVVHEHFARMVEQRPGTMPIAARDYFIKIIPEAEPFFALMTERGASLGAATSKLFALIQTYGKQSVVEAIKQAIARNYGDANYIANICEQEVRSKKKCFRLAVDLPDHLPGSRLTVTPHEASSYDDLLITETNKNLK